MRCCLVCSWMITDRKMLMQDVRSQMKVKWIFLEGWVVVYLPLRILDSYQWENNLFNCLSFIVIIIYIMYVCIILKIFDCWKKSYLLAKITEYFTWCRVLAATEIFCVTYIGSRLQDCTVNDLGWWHNLGKIFGVSHATSWRESWRCSFAATWYPTDLNFV